MKNETEKFPTFHYYRMGVIPRKLPPAGRVLVHNRVTASANTYHGERGFRAWMQEPDHRLVRCKCRWSGLLHYRYPVSRKPRCTAPQQRN